MKLKSLAPFIPAFLIAFIVPSFKAFSQEVMSPDAVYSTAADNAMKVYHHSFGSQSAIYNGPFYNEYLFTFKNGHAYFFSPDITIGSVTYDGIVYDSVQVQYDEIADAVVVRNRAAKISLPLERVTAFSLYGAYFIRLKKDTSATDASGLKYYNLLYNGGITLVKKEVKTIREIISPEIAIERLIEVKENYYVIRNEQWIPVSRKKDLFKVAGDHKDEVRKFIRTNKLNFRKDKQNTITKSIAFYDSLK